ncbi:MAG: sporulation transcriptional regulator SpoIIID [bacterium]
MKDHIQKRVLEIGDYILATKTTVRRAARIFSVSKSTVHIVLTKQNGQHFKQKKKTGS